MKTNSIFIWLISIWSIDFITTILSLSYFDNLYEGNRLLNPIYNLGFFGYVLVFIITIIIFYLFSLLLIKLSHYKDNSYSTLIQIIPIIIFWGLEIKTILNNVNLML